MKSFLYHSSTNKTNHVLQCTYNYTDTIRYSAFVRHVFYALSGPYTDFLGQVMMLLILQLLLAGNNITSCHHTIYIAVYHPKKLIMPLTNSRISLLFVFSSLCQSTVDVGLYNQRAPKTFAFLRALEPYLYSDPTFIGNAKTYPATTTVTDMLFAQVSTRYDMT